MNPTHLCELSHGFKKLIRGTRKLRFEKCKPEKLCIFTFDEHLADLACEVRIDDILHIQFIKIVSPWMKNLKALILDTLVSISFNVGLEETKGGLVRFDGAFEVVFSDVFGLMFQECSNSLNASSTLEVLTINELINIFVKILCLSGLLNAQFFENSHQNSLVTLKVPVHVDYLVDDSCLEHLVGFIREKVHDIVHAVDFRDIL